MVSAHRMPDEMLDYGRNAHSRGLRVLIAGAGGAAHLPGMLAAVTPLPVIGVPVPLRYLDGMDSLLSIVQMPAGVPVATVSIGNARNAGLLAVRVLATSDEALRERMAAFQVELGEKAAAKGGAVGPTRRRASGAGVGALPAVDDPAQCATTITQHVAVQYRNSARSVRCTTTSAPGGRGGARPWRRSAVRVAAAGRSPSACRVEDGHLRARLVHGVLPRRARATSRMSSESGLNAAPSAATLAPATLRRQFADEVNRAGAAPLVDGVDLAQEGDGLADPKLLRAMGERPDVLGQAAAAEAEARFEEPAADPVVVGQRPEPDR